MPRISDAHLAAWRALLNAHSAAVRRISRSLQEQGGLPLESYDVLLELYYAPDRRLRLKELGARVVLTRSGISRLVTRLEREGLVVRGSVDQDARGVYATLTKKGEAAFRRTWPLYAEGIHEVFGSSMTEDEALTIAAILDRIRARG